MKERKFNTPGELIAIDMARYGLTQAMLAEETGFDPAVICKLVGDQRAVTPATARKLSVVTKRPAWEYFEAQARLWFDQDAKPQGMARVYGRRKKEGEK